MKKLNRIVAIVATLCCSAVFGMSAATAQPAGPPPAQIALAKEVILLKGGTLMFDPLVPGVIENVKNMFLPTNINLSKELNDVAAQLKKQYEPKKAELANEVARSYAKRFTEQELKEIITFYKSPLGKKVLVEEPNVLEEANKRAQDFANEFTEQIMTRMRDEMKKRGFNL
jgi:hypothetical protein